MVQYKAQTNELTIIELPSSIQQVYWNKKMAAPGTSVILEIFTHFVGNGSQLTIEISGESGKNYGTSKHNISGNRLRAAVKIPENAKDLLYAIVELPKHSLKQKSGTLLVTPAIKISNAKWDKKVTFQGDLLKIQADIEGLSDGHEATVEIWEHDTDAAHDLITEFPVIIKNDKVETEWEFLYQGNVDQLLAARENGHKDAPQFYYRVKAGEVSVDSELIKLNWILVELLGEDDKPIPAEKYKIELPDGSIREGELDDSGRAFMYDIEKPGDCKICFTEIDQDAWEKMDV